MSQFKHVSESPTSPIRIVRRHIDLGQAFPAKAQGNVATVLTRHNARMKGTSIIITRDGRRGDPKCAIHTNDRFGRAIVVEAQHRTLDAALSDSCERLDARLRQSQGGNRRHHKSSKMGYLNSAVHSGRGRGGHPPPLHATM